MQTIDRMDTQIQQNNTMSSKYIIAALIIVGLFLPIILPIILPFAILKSLFFSQGRKDPFTIDRLELWSDTNERSFEPFNVDCLENLTSSIIKPSDACSVADVAASAAASASASASASAAATAVASAVASATAAALTQHCQRVQYNLGAIDFTVRRLSQQLTSPYDFQEAVNIGMGILKLTSIDELEDIIMPHIDEKNKKAFNVF